MCARLSGRIPAAFDCKLVRMRLISKRYNQPFARNPQKASSLIGRRGLLERPAAPAGGGVKDLVYKHTLREIIAGQGVLCSSVYCCATTVPKWGAAH